MELTQLRYFAAVAELQHVTRAAERMHVAQPAITKSIHRLEDELGVPLIASRGRNIVLTDYGCALYGMLREPLAALDQIPDQMQQLARRSAYTLHINVLAASRAVTDAVIAYKHDHSEILFSIMQNELTQICDLSVDTLTEKRSTPETAENTVSFQEQILLAVPSHSLYSGLRSIRSERIEGRRLYLSGRQPEVPQDLRSILSDGRLSSEDYFRKRQPGDSPQFNRRGQRHWFLAGTHLGRGRRRRQARPHRESAMFPGVTNLAASAG